jgi:hypothetical protein
MIELRRRWNDYSTQGSFDLTDMRSGFLALYPWRRRTPAKFGAFAPILWLKNEAEFTWGADQQRAFENIKRYLSSPPVMKAPMAGSHFGYTSLSRMS